MTRRDDVTRMCDEIEAATKAEHEEKNDDYHKEVSALQKEKVEDCIKKNLMGMVHHCKDSDLDVLSFLSGFGCGYCQALDDHDIR